MNTLQYTVDPEFENHVHSVLQHKPWTSFTFDVYQDAFDLEEQVEPFNVDTVFAAMEPAVERVYPNAALGYFPNGGSTDRRVDPVPWSQLFHFAQEHGYTVEEINLRDRIITLFHPAFGAGRE